MRTYLIIHAYAILVYIGLSILLRVILGKPTEKIKEETTGNREIEVH